MLDNYLVKTFFGLEGVLAQEIRAMGGLDVKEENRAVSCKGDLELCYRLNHQCRTAIAVLRPLVRGTVRNEDEVYQLVQSVKWYEWFEIKKTFSVRVVCYSDLFRNSHFLTLKSKDAIVDQFREKYKRRPSVSKVGDVKIDVFIKNDKCIISLDTSGASLFKRGYRLKTGEAPINEVLAAGIIRLSEWQPGQSLIDPMCGAGTIPIEAALMSKHIAPHFLRSDFSLIHLSDFNSRIWQKVTDNEQEPQASEIHIAGCDHDAQVLRIARNNARNAGIQEIEWRSKDFFQLVPKMDPGILLFNPPYDERLPLDDAIAFYKRIGDQLKQNWAGWQAFMISSHLQAIKHVGLKPSKRIPLYNGALECRLVKFELY